MWIEMWDGIWDAMASWSWSYDVVHFDADSKVQRQDGAVDERLGLPQSFCEVLL